MGESLGAKRVLVVGASSGIGQGVAAALAREGAAVAVAGRRHAELEKLCVDLGPASVPVRGDVRDPSSCDDMVRVAGDALGGLDALVYAAGVSPLAALAEADAALWHQVMETNVIGASLVCRAALPHLRASGGRAVFLGSSSVGRPFPGLSPYAASKAALEELVRGWRAENPDVSFTTVVVGPTGGTEFAAAWDPERTARMFPFWERNGYLTGGAAMDVAEIGHTVCSVLAWTASVWTVAVQACDRSAEPLRI